MSFIRVKEVKGHEYYYLVENKRYGKKVVQTILVYYGKNPPKEIETKKLSKLININEFFTRNLKMFIFENTIDILYPNRFKTKYKNNKYFEKLSNT